jgi:hypothetical protein
LRPLAALNRRLACSLFEARLPQPSNIHHSACLPHCNHLAHLVLCVI